MHKKFASTGFLCHRFGGYLAPIEESQDEPPLQLEKGSNIIKNSTSCYDLVRDNFTSMNENCETNHLTNTECTNSKNNNYHNAKTCSIKSKTNGPVLSYSQASVINNASNDFSSHIKNECTTASFNRLTPVLDNDFLNEPIESHIGEYFLHLNFSLPAYFVCMGKISFKLSLKLDIFIELSICFRKGHLFSCTEALLELKSIELF